MSEEVKGANPEPNFNYSREHKIAAVTKEHLDYFKSQQFALKVYAFPSLKPAVAKTAT